MLNFKFNSNFNLYSILSRQPRLGFARDIVYIYYTICHTICINLYSALKLSLASSDWCTVRTRGSCLEPVSPHPRHHLQGAPASDLLWADQSEAWICDISQSEARELQSSPVIPFLVTARPSQCANSVQKENCSQGAMQTAKAEMCNSGVWLRRKRLHLSFDNCAI